MCYTYQLIDFAPAIDPAGSYKDSGKTKVVLSIARPRGNRNGEGTEFIIDLPTSESSPAPEVELDSHLRTGVGRILVMDDEEALQKLMNRILSKLGYEVQTASDGADAIALFQRLWVATTPESRMGRSRSPGKHCKSAYTRAVAMRRARDLDRSG
jgi:hypothetical protein